ncbi:MAG: hypothetical protein M5U19_06570 [Microthrixaceae bacterium]|nr:hypothetical protein [Microthrixaceae bacterium]
MTDTTTNPSTDLEEEVRTWLSENWDPDLTVAQWWSAWALPAGRLRTCPRTPTGVASREATVWSCRARSAPSGPWVRLRVWACCSQRRRSPSTAPGADRHLRA